MFLVVLRKMSMLADAISYAILPGLVAGCSVAQAPNLLTGFVGAIVAAIVTVSLVAAQNSFDDAGQRLRRPRAYGQIVLPNQQCRDSGDTQLHSLGDIVLDGAAILFFIQRCIEFCRRQPGLGGQRAQRLARV